MLHISERPAKHAKDGEIVNAGLRLRTDFILVFVESKGGSCIQHLCQNYLLKHDFCVFRGPLRNVHLSRVTDDGDWRGESYGIFAFRSIRGEKPLGGAARADFERDLAEAAGAVADVGGFFAVDVDARVAIAAGELNADEAALACRLVGGFARR